MIKKLTYLFTILFIVLTFYFLWNNYRFLFNDQPRLDNKKYPLELDTIRTIKKKLYKEKASTAVLEKKFIRLINHKIFPYWYGTRWNFHGTTQKPNEGSIACGYFVTTTLRDMGVPLNRVKLAQCASEEMIRTLCAKKHIYHLPRINIHEFEKALQKRGDGLYIVGLDKHTGFILLSNEGNYFIHSSGMYPFQVIKEKLTESTVLSRSSYRVVGKISADENFLKKWVASGN